MARGDAIAAATEMSHYVGKTFRHAIYQGLLLHVNGIFCDTEKKSPHYLPNFNLVIQLLNTNQVYRIALEDFESSFVPLASDIDSVFY
jgi:hypothetical protein